MEEEKKEVLEVSEVNEEELEKQRQKKAITAFVLSMVGNFGR